VLLASAPIGVLLGFWDELRVVTVLLTRLKDVFDQEPEQGHDHSHLRPVETLDGHVRLRRVSDSTARPRGRARGQAEHGPAARGAHGVRDRAPAFDDPRRRPDLRPRTRRLVEQGTHEQLIARGGLYAYLHAQQLES
jgi:hypothetical protein